MSVRVNLLPGDVKAKANADRSRLLAAAAAGVFVLLLGGIWWLQVQQVEEAEARLAAVEATNADLQAQITSLQPFVDLEQRATSAADTVSRALGREISLTAVLQDLSAVLPPNVELTSVSVAAGTEPESPAPGGTQLVEARLNATGRATGGLAPGIERLLIDLDRVSSFDNVYVTSATTDENGVVTFALEVELGTEVLTGRYDAVGVEVTP